MRIFGIGGGKMTVCDFKTVQDRGPGGPHRNQIAFHGEHAEHIRYGDIARGEAAADLGGAYDRRIGIRGTAIGIGAEISQIGLRAGNDVLLAYRIRHDQCIFGISEHGVHIYGRNLRFFRRRICLRQDGGCVFRAAGGNVRHRSASAKNTA